MFDDLDNIEGDISNINGSGDVIESRGNDPVVKIFYFLIYILRFLFVPHAAIIMILTNVISYFLKDRQRGLFYRSPVDITLEKLNKICIDE